MKKIEMLQIKKDKNVLKTGSLCKVYKKSVGNKEKLSIYCKKHFHFLDLKYMERDTLLCYFAQKKEESNMRRWHYKMLKKTVAIVLSAAMVTGTINLQTTNTQAVDRSKPWLLSTNRPAYSSSVNGGDVASFATDGRLGTQWGAAADVADQWLDVDLGGKAYSVNKVVLTWENAYGQAYDIQVSNDGTKWTTVKEMRDQNGGEDIVEFNSVSARYVRMQGVTRATGYGYSLWEMEVYGGNSSQQPETPEPTKPSEEETEAPTTSPLSGTNVAQGKKTEQSGAEATAMGADKTVDGNKGTRWSSNFDDDAWMYVDLGKQIDINKVVITWENAYGKAYDIQVSNDGTNWTTVAQMRDQDGGEDTVEFKTVNARYVKFQGVTRAMGYGYSMWEFEVFAK